MKMLGEEMLDKEKSVEMYRRMLTVRRFEEKQIELYVKGIIEGMAPHASIGGEAVGVGVGFCLRKDDYILPTHRGYGHVIGKGTSLQRLMAEILTRKTGLCKGKGGIHIADFEFGILGTTGIVGAQFPISVGVGLSIKTRKTDQVCVCYFGDGASNRGPFHEALNIAALWKLPVIYVCENNMYAIHTHFHKSSAAENIADRAVAYGIPGKIVDGCDVEAVHRTTCEAVQRARKMLGPTLIECKLYRWRPHSERYFDPRPKEEIEKHMENCPIKRHRNKLIRSNIASDEELDQLEKEIVAAIEEAAEFAQKSPRPELDEVTTDIFV
jgi:TPP-dependent pyruvate/acetoin dehydrogenase alpha subunit